MTGVQTCALPISPHVTGVAAQVWAADTSQTNDWVRALLKSTAQDLNLPATQQGAGLVRADLATKAVAPVSTGTVTGTVRNQESDLEIPDAVITIKGTSLSSTSGVNGEYQIVGVPTGSHTITAVAAGYETMTTTEVLVEEATNTICNFSLHPVTMYRLTIGQEGEGTTEPQSGSSYDYASGTVVDLLATPSAGYQFSKWVIDGVNEIFSPSATVTMDSDKTVVAWFSQTTATPSVAVWTDKPEYSGNIWVYITAEVKDMSTAPAKPMPGAPVTIIVKNPVASLTTYSGTTDLSGKITIKHRILKTSEKGTYSIEASIVWNGTASDSAQSSFVVL